MTKKQAESLLRVFLTGIGDNFRIALSEEIQIALRAIGSMGLEELLSLAKKIAKIEKIVAAAGKVVIFKQSINDPPKTTSPDELFSGFLDLLKSVEERIKDPAWR